MANASEKPELEDPPSSLRSPVWEHFGFPVKVTDGQRQVDKSKVVCRHCSTTEIGYAAGNTSNMLTHLKRHHPSVNVSSTRKKTSLVQTVTPITSAFKQHLASNSDRAKAITHGIGVFIATGLRQYSVVENAGFKYMIKVLEPRYEIPSRPHFSQQVQEEVSKYRASGCLSLEADPLLWWNGNEATYPHIAKLAKRYLCIPATSVASERVFSTAGDIVTATRSVLSAENVDKLIFLAKNFKLE
ncbi:E3 SUMO-protein ligase ZBED1-like [Polypterus senegalus]|uniref:E3 SUMO-protein ligase ZBED1-like n=1 Tax=Polypterus senegalus TaxID=55291 RepID=UPI001962C000|nr:E3 SUMO-protein ligase ZBED1-like [Polypterus senegalus]